MKGLTRPHRDLWLTVDMKNASSRGRVVASSIVVTAIFVGSITLTAIHPESRPASEQVQRIVAILASQRWRTWALPERRTS